MAGKSPKSNAKSGDSKSRRSRGMGGIILRGEKFYYRYNVGGKVKQVSLHTSNLAEAEKIVAEEYEPMVRLRSKEEMAVHIAVSRKYVKPREKTTLDQAWKKYFAATNRPDSSLSTLKGYERILKIFVEWLKKDFPSVTHVQQIDDDVARAYAGHIWESEVSERTYNAYIKAMHLLFRVLMPGEKNPFSRDVISRKNENQQGHWKLTEKQIITVLNSFDQAELTLMYKEEMKILFYIGALTGLRLADCCLLKWQNVYLDDGLIRCIPTKTKRIGRQAIIPIADELRKQLLVADEWRDGDYILPKIADRYIRNPYGIRKDVLKVLEFADLKTTEKIPEGMHRTKNICRYGFHSFRHSFASIMASRGYSINMLAQILADDTRTLDKYYIDIDDHVIRDAFSKIFLPAAQDKQDVQVDEEKQHLLIQINQQLPELSSKQLKSIITKIKTIRKT